jgi:hypothetical protein
VEDDDVEEDKPDMKQQQSDVSGDGQSLRVASVDSREDKSQKKKKKRKSTASEHGSATRRVVKMLVLFFGLLFHVRLYWMNA